MARGCGGRLIGRLIGIGVSLTAVLAGIPGCAGTHASTSSPAVPLEVTEYSGWVLPNRDCANTRCDNSSSIGLSNVSRLGIAWAVPVAGLAKGNPIIAGGLVYYQDFERNVIAVDEYGNIRWRNLYRAPSAGPKGVAVGYGQVFAPVSAGRVAALDAATGKERWLSTVSNNSTLMVDMQPTTYGGSVLVSTNTAGLTQGEVGGQVGSIFSLDAQTGAIKWRFGTSDSPEVWGNPAVNGGGGCHFPPAVDNASGTAYWGTDGPAPFPGTDQFPNGSSRLGPDLYTNSMLAIDAGTGKLVWYNQVLPHDLLGYSLSVSPVLATVAVNGTARNAVIGSGKSGFVYAFDRGTGAVLWRTAVGKHRNDNVTALPPGPTEVFPGGNGGVEMPMALSGGTLYVVVSNASANFTPTSYSAESILEASSELVALDVSTGSVVWTHAFDAWASSPPTVTNGVVFIGTLDGLIYGLDRATGSEVWRYEASADPSTGWVAVSGDLLVVGANLDGVPCLIGLRVGANEPGIVVASPVTDSWVAPESDVTVRVVVFNFTITALGAGGNAGKEGHLIFYFNVDAPTAPGQPAFSAPGTYAVSANTSFTWRNLKMSQEGGYGFWVQLVHNDNTPLAPPVLAATVVNIMGFHPD